MPTNRFQFSDDFVLNNGYVGINSATPQEELDVAGVVRGDNLKVVGVSSFSGYEGFLNSNQNITENINLDANRGITGSLSGEIVVGTGLTITGIGSAVSGQGYIDSLKVYTTLNVPVGLTTDRPIAPQPGQLFYNREFATVEFYTGDAWRQVDNRTTRGRGVWSGGGVGPADSSLIEYINISSTGNSINFGNLTAARRFTTSCASSVRGIIHGGVSQTAIDYITIASEGNGISFGTANNRASSASASSSTRGLFAGGYQPANPTNVIEYVQISTLGNPIDFGDLLTARYYLSGLSSPTRAVFLGGFTPTPASSVLSIIDFVTISSIGNAVRFGDLTSTSTQGGAVSSSTRGVYSGGLASFAPVYINNIDYITIASTGNATDFGDLANSHSQRNNGASTQIRGVFGGGYTVPGVNINILEYITIATTGNAQDFGDLSQPRRALTGLSDSHGGLGGF